MDNIDHEENEEEGTHPKVSLEDMVDQEEDVPVLQPEDVFVIESFVPAGDYDDVDPSIGLPIQQETKEMKVLADTQNLEHIKTTTETQRDVLVGHDNNTFNETTPVSLGLHHPLELDLLVEGQTTHLLPEQTIQSEDIIIDDPLYNHHHNHKGKRFQELIDKQCAISYGLATKGANKSKILTGIWDRLQKAGNGKNSSTRFLVVVNGYPLHHEGFQYRLARGDEIMEAIKLAVKDHYIEEPGDMDILFGLGFRTRENYGNRLFRGFIEKHLDEYEKVRRDKQKRLLLFEATEKYVRSEGGRFLLPFNPGRPREDGCMDAPGGAIIKKIDHRYRDACCTSKQTKQKLPQPKPKSKTYSGVGPTTTVGSHRARNAHRRDMVSQWTSPQWLATQHGSQNVDKGTMMERPSNPFAVVGHHDHGNWSSDHFIHVDFACCDLESPAYWNLDSHAPCGNLGEGEQKVEDRNAIMANPEECTHHDPQEQNHDDFDGCSIASIEAIIQKFEPKYPRSTSALSELDHSIWDLESHACCDLDEHEQNVGEDDRHMPNPDLEECTEDLNVYDYLEECVVEDLETYEDLEDHSAYLVAAAVVVEEDHPDEYLDKLERAIQNEVECRLQAHHTSLCMYPGEQESSNTSRNTTFVQNVVIVAILVGFVVGIIVPVTIKKL